MNFIQKKLLDLKGQNSFRKLKVTSGLNDFCSNDYLGMVTNNKILLPDNNQYALGSKGSRLLAGNYKLIEEAEKKIATFHEAEAGLIFNSGYDANLGLFSCIGRKGDTILYDKLIHASIRDGMRLSLASCFSFAHNDLEDLEMKLRKGAGNIFVATESVFSMDGDFGKLSGISELCIKYNAGLIVDEAHSTGIIGERGEGLVQMLGLQDLCFARIHTFGKALGCHGAIILGAAELRDYLINFSRPFIFSTALPEHSVAAILSGYELFPNMKPERQLLQQYIRQWNSEEFPFLRTESSTAIQGIIIPGNNPVKSVAAQLQERGFDIRPVTYPSVAKGSERLRIVLHSFNTMDSIYALADHLRNITLEDSVID